MTTGAVTAAAPVPASISWHGTRPRRELLELGRSLRAEVPRARHAEVDLAWAGRDPLAILEASNRSRVPDLVPIRYARMLESPFTFFRGAPAVMAADLATTPVTGVNVQACGDAHLLNFGVFATPERHLAFDINDFDETLPAPWEWDVKRLAASCTVAARVAGHRAVEADAARWAAFSYASELRDLMDRTTLDIHYAHTDVDEVAMAESGHRFGDELRNLAVVSRAHSSVQAYSRYTEEVEGGRRRIVEHPPFIVRFSDDQARDHRIHDGLERYVQSLPDDRRHLLQAYRLTDFARKVVGVGSVGTRCSVVLFEGRGVRDPLFLQMKEAQASVLEPYVGPSAYPHAGRRVVEGQRLMQAVSDILLGWSEVDGYRFYVRQLRDMKGSVDLLTMRASSLVRYAALCGRTLARAHARSVGPSVICGYLGGGRPFADAVAAFSVAYADQNERDHAALRAAVRDGVVQAAGQAR